MKLNGMADEYDRLTIADDSLTRLFFTKLIIKWIYYY